MLVKRSISWDSPSGPVVKTPSSNAGGMSSIPGWELRSHMSCSVARNNTILKIKKRKESKYSTLKWQLCHLPSLQEPPYVGWTSLQKATNTLVVIFPVYQYCPGFPGGTRGKQSACQRRRRKRRWFNPWVGKMPWRRAWQLTPVFLPGESHGQSRLVGYSPRGHRELDTTEAT